MDSHEDIFVNATQSQQLRICIDLQKTLQHWGKQLAKSYVNSYFMNKIAEIFHFFV